jgi:hypothetical protein
MFANEEQINRLRHRTIDYIDDHELHEEQKAGRCRMFASPFE